MRTLKQRLQLEFQIAFVCGTNEADDIFLLFPADWCTTKNYGRLDNSILKTFLTKKTFLIIRKNALFLV